MERGTDLRKLKFLFWFFHLKMFDIGLATSLHEVWGELSPWDGTHIYLASRRKFCCCFGVMLWLFSSFVNAQYFTELGGCIFRQLVSSFQLLYLRGVARETMTLLALGWPKS